MEWLSPYHAILDCHAKTVTMAMPELPILEWRGSFVGTSNQVISFLKARHMVEKGCLSYLAFVGDTTAEIPTLYSVLVVREFSNIFSADLQGMPPNRDIDFGIDLVTSTQPVSTSPYRMALKELRELKEQLQELLEKEPTRVLACVVAQSSLFERINARQYDDPHLLVLRETVLQGGAKEVTIGEDGFL
ncbi:uncharacterized protein [Nicotiana tomentosiformis]|uniref:uncharacterized protein n=1 Tax=Nicotiana tomentosiformis TaxID=4098 RepID=UPI00388CC900